MENHYWVILAILIFKAQPSSPKSVKEMMRNIDQVHHAIDKLEDCLDNLRIPVGAKCRDTMLFDKEETIRLKYGISDIDFLAHSEKVSLSEHKEMAKMKCRLRSTCKVMRCVCPVDISCDKLQDKSATCEAEYATLIRRITASRMNDSKDETEPPVEELPHKVLTDDADEELLPKGKSAEELKEEEAEANKRFIRANTQRRFCLSNLRIPYRKPCNETIEKQKSKFIDDFLDNNGFDEGKLSLGLVRDLERHTCHLPAYCDLGRCRCDERCRKNNPRNLSVTCAQEQFEYLLASKGTGERVTLLELSEIESQTDPPTESPLAVSLETEEPIYPDPVDKLSPNITTRSGCSSFCHGRTYLAILSLVQFMGQFKLLSV